MSARKQPRISFQKAKQPASETKCNGMLFKKAIQCKIKHKNIQTVFFKHINRTGKSMEIVDRFSQNTKIIR